MLEKGEELYKFNDKINEMYIVQDGCLEAYTICEGNEFVLVKLERGSLLNQNILFNEDQMLLNVRASQSTVVYKITSDDAYKKLVYEFPEFEKKFNIRLTKSIQKV